MYESGLCFIFAYFAGTLSPAALIAALKKKNLRACGTGNLGATNVSLALGKFYGFIVMLFDIAKAYLSVKIAKLIFPQLAVAGLLAGLGAVAGHIFPFYMRFHGGKGLAPFGGAILAYDPGLFAILLAIGIVMILITDYPIALTFSAVSIAPFAAALRGEEPAKLCLLLGTSALVLFKHIENITRIKEGSEMKLSHYLHRSRDTAIEDQ